MNTGKKVPKLTHLQIQRLLSEVERIDEEIVPLTNEEVAEIEADYEAFKLTAEYQERQYKEFKELVPDIFDLLNGSSDEAGNEVKEPAKHRWDNVRHKREEKLNRFQEFTKRNKSENKAPYSERLSNIFANNDLLMAYRNSTSDSDEDIEGFINAAEFLSSEKSDHECD